MDAVAGIFNKLIVVGPFLLVTTLGVKAREQRPSFRYTAYSAIENQKISAYVPIVRETEGSISNRDALGIPLARKLAKEWIREGDSGLLKPISPVALDDSSRDGVKAEIIHDSGVVAETLNYKASEEIGAHQYRSATHDAMLAAVLLKTPRVFDFSSLSTCSLFERRSLLTIRKCLPKLSEQGREFVKRQLKGLLLTPEDLQSLTLDARSVLLTAEDSPNTSNENFAKLEGYVSMSRQPSLEELRKAKQEPIGSYSDEGIVDLVNEYRLGYSSALETNSEIKEIVIG